MDDIDLDVMFAADGDALFDGLDIDLDMDDITGGTVGGNSGSGALDASNRSSSSSFSRRAVNRPPPPTLPTSPNVENGDDDLSRTRRKAKRKAKTPAFFEGDDDDYYDAPTSKKKRKATSTSKAVAANAALSKKKTTAKVTQDDISLSLPVVVKSPPVISKGKNKAAKSSTTGMPPPVARTGPWVPTSSSGNGAQNVAAVGQFGNRQKQRASGTSFPSLPKGSGVPAPGVASTNQGGRIINKLPLSRTTIETSTKNKSSSQQRPIFKAESTYCGLQPSPTHFYPFMPALPTEPVLKSRKVYGSIDRIHTSLVGYLHTPPTTSSGIKHAKEHEPLFLLLQEAFKEEKSVAAALRLESIGISIGELRQTITSMDKNRIISDWYGVCSLIKRQHDFLKQNCDNMERWCRDNFSKEDFAEVFAPSKKRKENEVAATFSILKTFTKREIKVRISFAGMKDPKMPAFIVAVLPPLFLPNDLTTKDETETKQPSNTKKKSQAPSSLTSLQDGRVPDLIFPSSKANPPLPLSYANMKPPRRRKNVAEMITRTARELSKIQSLRIENTRKTIDRQEAELQKISSQDNAQGIHTAAMWKWVELSGFFNDFSAKDVDDSLQDIRSIAVPAVTGTEDDQTQSILKLGKGDDESADDATVYDRLQSLLVDVHFQDDNTSDCSTEGMDYGDENINEICNITEFVDMSSLALEERSCIILRNFGFTNVHTTEDIELPVDSTESTSLKKFKHSEHQNKKGQRQASAAKQSDDLDDVIASMKSELAHLEEINDERITYLESAAFQYRRLRQNKALQSERETGLIAKCQQLMRKSKELKAKSVATIKKDDSLALPW